MQTFRIEELETPTGPMLVVTDADGRLAGADWRDHEYRLRELLDRYYGAGRVQFVPAAGRSAAAKSLAAYFGGELGAIDTIPITVRTTPFQAEVWAALRRIPVGTTMSYGALAAALGRANAPRAVGHANGSNPISVVVPCHRLVGANGALTGYGGGIERKRWLLAHEGARKPA